MRGSQSSKPRHIPDFTGLLPNGASFSTGQENSYPERNYTLSSTQSEYSPQGHVDEFPWTLTGHTNPPDGDAPLAYSGAHGDCPPSYATSMADCAQNPPSYTASMECSTMYSNASPWTSSDVATTINPSSWIPMDNDYNMFSENVLSGSSSGIDFIPLPTEVDLLPVHQSSASMSSAHNFTSSGPFFHGNLPVGMPAVSNNIHIFQRTAMENQRQSWTNGQQTAGMAQQMPLTPPASDHGTPSDTQECSLSSQDSGQDEYDQHGYQLSQEGCQISHATHALTGITSRHQSHRLACIQSTPRFATNLTQHCKQKDSSRTEAYQIRIR